MEDFRIGSVFLAKGMDRFFMERALDEAHSAAESGNVPIGAVVVRNMEVIGCGHNEKSIDPTGHAEILAIRNACRTIGYWNLKGCSLYVTIEPCPMCAGAIVQARISDVVYGAPDPKAGACGSLYNIPSDLRLNHRSKIRGGVCVEECIALLQSYFLSKRAGK